MVLPIASLAQQVRFSQGIAGHIREPLAAREHRGVEPSFQPGRGEFILTGIWRPAAFGRLSGAILGQSELARISGPQTGCNRRDNGVETIVISDTKVVELVQIGDGDSGTGSQAVQDTPP